MPQLKMTQPLALARAIHQKGDLEGAERLYREICRKNPKNHEALHLLGIVLFQRELFDDSLVYLKKAVDLEPTVSVYHSNLGNAFISLDKVTDALKHYEIAIRLAPNFAEAICNRGAALSRLGMLDEALASFERAISIKPDYIDAMFNLGNVCLQLLFLERAIEAYSELLSYAASHDKARQNLGEAFLKLRRYSEAEECFEIGIQLNRKNFEFLNGLGKALFEQKKYEAAGRYFAEALQLNPQHAETQNNLGYLYELQNRNEDAAKLYEKATKSNPNLFEAHVNLGNLNAKLGNSAEALDAFANGLRIKPNSPDLYLLSGNLHFKQKSLDQAENFYLEAIRLNPSFAEAHHNRGIIRSHKGDPKEAERCFLQAITFRPDFFEAHNHLGALYIELGRVTESEPCLREAVRLSPTSGTAHVNLSSCLRNQGKAEEAEAVARKAINLDPGLPEAYFAAAEALSLQARILEAQDLYRRGIELNPYNARAFSNLLLLSLYTESSPAKIMSLAREYSDTFELPLKTFWKSHENTIEKNRKLKVGYVSGDFNNHSISFFILPIFRSHDKDKFEIYVYNTNLKKDNISAQIGSLVDHWIDTFGLTDDEFCEQIRRDQIDILIDLSGHTGLNRLPVFARKPAPVQMTWMGYPGTTGLSAIDYRITTASMDPIGLTEQHHSERLIRLPDIPIPFDQVIEFPEVNPLPASVKSHVTIACLNGHAKITPQAIDSWIQILQRIPDSKFILGNSTGTLIEKIFIEQLYQARIHQERLIRIPRLDLKGFFDLFGQIDLCVDPFPYCGGTTTFQSIWMGVPVVTLAGSSSQSRVGIGILNAFGLNDFVAHSIQEYVDKVVHWSNSLDELAELRRMLRQRLEVNHDVFSDFTSLLEDQFLCSWSIYCDQRNQI